MTEFLEAPKVEFNGKREWNEIFFQSRRSPVLSKYGIATSSQNIASNIGALILKKGGNAVDSCVAMNMALGVTEPMSTGIGGDMFALYYDNETKKVYGINGTGKSSHKLTYNMYHNILGKRNMKWNNAPKTDPIYVTVPGNVCGSLDMLERFGSMNRETVFTPAIKIAEHGFPVNSICASMWKNCEDVLYSGGNEKELLINDNGKYRAPYVGEIFKNRYLSNVLKQIMVYGKQGFYNSNITDKMLDVVNSKGGMLSKQDFSQHTSEFVDPIHLDYKGVKIWEIVCYYVLTFI